MYRHLVSVEVSVECGTNERMQLDCFTLYQDRLKCLNSQTVQCRSTVQHNRMLFDDFLEHVPYLRFQTLYTLLCTFNIMRNTVCNQFFHNKRFKQLDCHFLRQTALINLQLRSYDNNGTSGIVYTLSEQVLTETSGLTLEHVRQRLQCTVARAGNRTATTTVIDQGINCLLQHTLLVADDDVRSAQLQQSLKTVVPVDDTTIQIIQVRGCKTPSIQLHHRAQIWRNDRNYIHNHPLRTVTGLTKCLYDFQALDDSGTLLTGGLLQTSLELLRLLFHVNCL